jgi:hypothetical protein
VAPPSCGQAAVVGGQASGQRQWVLSGSPHGDSAWTSASGSDSSEL